MKYQKYLFVIIATLLISISGFRVIENPVFISKLKESLRAYNSSCAEEKVYVQLDKPFYKPGEDIWFNVFVLNSNTLKPTNTSDVVYVELIDPKGNISSRLELIIKEGTAHGDFSTQGSAPGGLYHIQAYTQWMKNFGTENFFRKDIQVQHILTPRLLIKLDFEKESYGPGENVSAKLNVTNLKNEKEVNASVNFNVQINGNQILASEIRSDLQGEANIHFQLPDTLSTTDGLLQAIVKTQGVEESISRSIPIVLNKITVQFYPEGGHTLHNVHSKIAFKAVNEFGKSADIAGSIVDENNNVVTQFKSFHMGMGAFDLEPSEGKKYFARIETPSGNRSLTLLPQAIPHGFVLNLKGKSETTVDWSIFSTRDCYVHLVGQSHGEIYYAEKIQLKQGKNSITVSTEKFPIGIGVFTLFDAGGAEQCERLVFLNPNMGLTIRLKTDKPRYLPREKIHVSVETLDNHGKPVPAKVSLAVVDDQLITFADDKQDNILSSLLLSSEIKGDIQEPSFYFDPNEPKANEALDYLLMTQGWRRFVWEDVYENNRAFNYTPEKVKNLGGQLVNSHGVGFSSEVTLLELGNKKRIVKVQTTKEGHFLFRNIDPTIPILLLTKKPGKITVQKEKTLSASLNAKVGTVIHGDDKNENIGVIESPVPTRANSELVANESGLDINMAADVTQLNEVIVTGLGVENKRALTASITTIYENYLESKFSSETFENIMQGRVAGVIIQPQTGNPASQSNLIIRGISSFGGGRSEPLYVIDGHPVGTSLNQNFSNGSMIGPDDIQSIEVINSPEASALYGSRAANGAILITTRTWFGYYPFLTKQKPAKYSSLTILPRKFSATREFYSPATAIKNKTRTDFRTTVYWNHTLATDEEGKAAISFYNNDAVSSFRITAEGFSGSGLVGRKEEVYYTELPLSLDTKLPEFLGFEDVLKLPVRVKNETSDVISGKVTITLPMGLSVQEELIRRINVQPKSTETLWFTINPDGVEGDFSIAIKLESEGFADETKSIVRVQPTGFPVSLSFSAKELNKTVRLSTQDAEQNSLKAELIAFPDVLSDLFTGAESILREPYGCFEQVSSSTFPNILALQFLKQSGQVKSDIEKRAVKYIESGYSKLLSYEIKGGGFEWFGHPPAHEGLTAYGLVQFHEMKKVYPGVDDQMMKRTRDWLLGNRNGKGGYKQHTGKYGFSAASSDVTNAYITFALSETGTTDILPEYAHALAEVLESKDMYRMAIVASTAFNLGKVEDYNALVNNFKEKVRTTGFTDLKADHSIVRSYGHSLENETISLWTVALMKASSPDLTLVNDCIQHILKGRSYGQFGSTQATTLALKALTEYANLVRTIREDGDIQIFVDNKLAEKLHYEKHDREKLVLKEFAKKLNRNGDQTLRIQFDGTTEPLPYSVDIKWHTKKPQSSDQCKVNLSTALSARSVPVNGSVRLTSTLGNKTSDGLPMVVAVIGIPAGLSIQPWQLKELQEKAVFDFYEILNGNLVIYYREMAPNGEYIINLDLKAEIPGSYTARASSAYLYYTNEYKHWVNGNSIIIHN